MCHLVVDSLPLFVTIPFACKLLIPVTISRALIQKTFVWTQFWKLCLQFSSKHKKCWGCPCATVRGGSIGQQEFIQFIFPFLPFYFSYLEWFSQSSVLLLYFIISLRPKDWKVLVLDAMCSQEVFKLLWHKLRCIVRLKAEWLSIPCWTHRSIRAHGFEDLL